MHLVFDESISHSRKKKKNDEGLNIVNSLENLNIEETSNNDKSNNENKI